MKKLFLLVLMLVALPMFLLAQGVDTPETKFGAYFLTFSSMLAIIPFISEWIKRVFSVAEGWPSRITSWVIGFLVALAGWLFHAGIMVDLLWWQMLIVGFGLSLASNGIFLVI